MEAATDDLQFLPLWLHIDQPFLDLGEDQSDRELEVASHTYGKMPVVHHTIVASLGYLILAQSASRCTRLQIEALTTMKLSVHNEFQ